MITRLGRTLRHLRAAFEELGVRWYVFGAQAVIAYGVVRSTADIDVTVEQGAVATAAIVEALVRHGFALTFEDPAFIARTRVLALRHESGLPVDVVLAGAGFDAPFFERTVRRKLGGVFVPVAAAEDIVVMKILAQRGKDLTDVRDLLVVNRRISIGRVRGTLEVLEDALGQSDLLPVFDAAVRQARRVTPRGGT